MKIAIRVDSSSQIGTGHFMRCLALADTLKQHGAQIRFVSRHLPEHLRSMLAEKGYEFALLDSLQNDVSLDELTHAHWLGISQAQDATDTSHALSDQTWDWLVVDHYALDVRWEAVLHNAAKRILVIDDIADRRHDCDALLDQNFHADMDIRYAGKVPAHCRLLLGPRYALLRDEFRELRKQVKPRAGEIKKVLVFFGGVDAGNYTGRAVEALSKIHVTNLRVDVVIGAQHPCTERIKEACAQYGFICHVQTGKMAELMAAADLAIGAGGSAAWERCCLGLPALTLCVADNQRKQIAEAAYKGLLYAPELGNKLIPAIRRHVIALMENGYLREALSRNGMQAVDGRGVLRVIGNMNCNGIEIRLAGPDDSEKLFEWRNHPTIRAVSHKPDIIKWEDHQKWFASVVSSSDRLLLIGHCKGSPVGVVRFDIKGNEASISIYLVPDISQPAQGRDLLQCAEHWLTANRPEVNKISACVLGSNDRSRRLFSGAGYQIEPISYSKRLY
ncbi:MAG: UDP-2,4-diacetamido-2,4,6-trideoxy-beta-L-altropyranose hydrolase [Gallionellaceae bacterium]|jgi:UDP-2,4-diacetamido-2,4,6-trideoxy-beta-L-altropyranose hydrolase|nr:UDP-2,4-diacetamido-2,4,6-trideoxy-beta-L-altropyranose hydrolase [Gallionellaceae bacterium]